MNNFYLFGVNIDLIGDTWIRKDYLREWRTGWRSSSEGYAGRSASDSTNYWWLGISRGYCPRSVWVSYWRRWDHCLIYRPQRHLPILILCLSILCWHRPQLLTLFSKIFSPPVGTAERTGLEYYFVYIITSSSITLNKIEYQLPLGLSKTCLAEFISECSLVF